MSRFWSSATSASLFGSNMSTVRIVISPIRNYDRFQLLFSAFLLTLVSAPSRQLILLALLELGLSLQPMIEFLACLTASFHIEFIGPLSDLLYCRRCGVLVNCKCSPSHGDSTPPV